MPDFVYKVADGKSFEAARQRGVYAGAPIDLADGFIHLSTAEQLAETLRLHFKGQGGLLLAAVDTSKLGEGLHWEPSRGGALFPHFYGKLEMSAVAWTEAIAVDEEGNCTLPARLG